MVRGAPKITVTFQRHLIARTFGYPIALYIECHNSWPHHHKNLALFSFIFSAYGPHRIIG